MDLLKIILGVGIIVIIWFLFPVLDILQLFLTIVCIPLILMVALGLLSEGTYNLLHTWPSQLKVRIEHFRDELRDRDPVSAK